MPAEGIGALLRRLRVDRGLTIEALAERSSVSVRGISDLERGRRTAPRAGTVVALADALALGGSERDALVEGMRAARLPASAVEPASARPFELSDFTGRRHELRSIAVLLDASGLGGGALTPVVLSGPPGIGKTSLAVQAADSGARGRPVLHVDLGGASSDPMTALQAIQSLLRQVPDGPRVPLTLADAVEAWERCTDGSPVVVVLDDAGAESQVRPALRIGRGSTVLVTSRRTLAGLEGARHLTIGRWPRADSVAFLRRGMPAAAGSDADLDALAELCGDLPLALRVTVGRAAARTAGTAAELVQELRSSSSPLSLLAAGDLEVERTFAASYAVLSERRRALFRGLGLLPARSFSAAAAGAVQEVDEDEALEGVEDLVDLGLVEAVGRDRFRLHDLLRLYAVDRVRREVRETDRLQLTVDRWYVGTAACAADAFAPEGRARWAAQPSPVVRFPDDEHARRWLRDEADGWFAGLRRLAAAGRHEEVLAAAVHLAVFKESSLDLGRWAEFYTLAVASAAAAGNPRAEAEYLTGLAYTYNFETFEADRALAAAGRAAAIARSAGLPGAEADAVFHLAVATRRLGQPDGAERAFRRAGDLYAEAGEPEAEVTVRQELASLRLESDPEGAVAEFQEVLRLTDVHAHVLTVGGRMLTRTAALGSLTAALTALGRTGEAVEHGTRAVVESGSDSGALARSRAHRGFARLADGDRTGGIEDLREALRLAGPRRPQYWADRIEDALRSA